MAAAEAARTEHGVVVQDTAWEGYEEIPAWIMQGYGTMAGEAAEQLGERPTHVFVQAGVGSLAGAVVGYFANLYPDNPPKFVVMEAQIADCLYQGAVAGDGKPRIVGGDLQTIMAGLACGEPNTIGWDILRNHVDAFLSCPDWVSARGMRMLAAPVKGDPAVCSGESGAVGMGVISTIMEDDAIIYGRGGSDQEGGMASAVYGAKIMKDLGLIPDDYRIMVVGSVQEEDCDGMCWQYIVNKFFPANGIYKMADILQDVRALNENPADDTVEVKGLVKMLDPKYNPEHYEDARFLGRGTCTTSQIFCTSPSRCAVADSCSISIDRRMTAGETWDSCLQEIRDLPAVQKYGDDVKVSMYMYDRPAWTGTVYETEAYFPTWINKESAAHVQALVDAHHALFGAERLGHSDSDPARDAMHLRRRPLTDKWTFSTNGVAIQGRYVHRQGPHLPEGSGGGRHPGPQGRRAGAEAHPGEPPVRHRPPHPVHGGYAPHYPRVRRRGEPEGQEGGHDLGLLPRLPPRPSIRRWTTPPTRASRQKAGWRPSCCPANRRWRTGGLWRSAGAV